MSYERPDSDRGPYTPPTDDDPLAFDRSGFDARGPARERRAPLTLIASVAVLLVLIAAVILFYRSGVRGANQAPPAVGTPVEALTGDAPEEAQPIDPAAGIDVYSPGATEGEPEFTPPPELPRERPAPLVPSAESPAARTETPPAATLPATPPKSEPTPAPTPAPAPTPPPAPAPSGGAAAVQIGAFSSQAIADREYAAVAGAFPQFAAGASKRVEQVQTASGQTVYRTTFTGLSAEDARAFCAALRASGRDCLVR